MQSIARMRIAAHRATRLLATGAVVVAALALASARPIAKDGFALRDGDRVVFYGDSITEARHYTTFVETYVVTRFPRLDATFVHSGWGGDGVNGGHGGDIDTRLARDVLAYEPTVLTIMLGMNDGGTRAFDAGVFETYAAGLPPHPGQRPKKPTRPAHHGPPSVAVRRRHARAGLPGRL
jgi:lysophospholipase L1-like esterase